MHGEIELPSELLSVAHALEGEIHSLRLCGKIISRTEWESSPQHVRRLIPCWLMELLARYSITNVVLERRHEFEEWERYFSFWPPSWYADWLKTDRSIMSREIIKDGFFPLSNESDGDMWVTSTTGGPSSPIYIFEQSAWKKTLVGNNLATFLASCKVSMNQSM